MEYRVYNTRCFFHSIFYCNTATPSYLVDCLPSYTYYLYCLYICMTRLYYIHIHKTPWDELLIICRFRHRSPSSFPPFFFFFPTMTKLLETTVSVCICFITSVLLQMNDYSGRCWTHRRLIKAPEGKDASFCKFLWHTRVQVYTRTHLMPEGHVMMIVQDSWALSTCIHLLQEHMKQDPKRNF